MVSNVNYTWNYHAIFLQHCMCSSKSVCMALVVIFTVVFLILRVGNMQASLAPVNEKYLVFNECCLEFCSFFVLLHIFLT